MDTQLYDVYLTGKLADGVTAEAAAQRLAALFKSTPAAMAGMLTGKPQLLKRNIDKATALKYREALQKAGLDVAFKSQPLAAADTAIEKTGAVAASAAPALELAPAGTDVLRADERRPAATAAVDTGNLALAALSPLPPSAPTSAPIAPSTDYLSLAAAGTELLTAAERSKPPALTPDISELSLAPVDTPIETLATVATEINPDISQLTLAPAGAELLSAEQRQKPAIAVPDTAHIQLADQ